MKAVTEIAQQLKWSSNLENILSLNLPRSNDMYMSIQLTRDMKTTNTEK